ncbi:DNA primase [Kiloniella sp. b19]|uniref:DNA primase n=1 Tax=Kiloniella sp. GXU_MW_B19 TaxID=3141326 RepID=UPI0031E3235D
MSSITPEYLDELRARVAASAVVGRKVKLVKKGREHSGLCPFHNEKTPSFTVNDEKGFYHCFGCGAHGDIVSFLIETEGLSFIEAVERLSEMAGMEMPRATREEQEKSVKRASLYDVIEAVCVWFEDQLHGLGGQDARDYVARRGLREQTIKRFRLGYAPDTRGKLRKAMHDKGFTDEQLVDIGVLKQAEEDSGRRKKGEFYDFFIHRLMFPITDRRGRVIAFGGRALGESKAKYLNSPDTVLFHKGRILYNMAHARQAAHQSGEVIVAEGYMDVIAMAQAGFPAAVAPLGTAVTEEQIAELWRMAPEPIVCLDGDAAGQRAAHRSIDRALPILKPGSSLRFATLPEGDDPDSLIQEKGAQAFRDVLKKAEPLSEVFWKKMLAGHAIDTPERRAALKSDIRKQIGLIRDGDLKNEYQKEMLRRFDGLTAPEKKGGGSRGGNYGGNHAGRGGGGGYNQWNGGYGGNSGRYGNGNRGGGRGQGGWQGGRIGRPGLPQRGLPRPQGVDRQSGPGNNLARRQEQVLLAALVNHPSVLAQYAEELGALQLSSVECNHFLQELLDRIMRDPDLDSADLKCQLSDRGLSGMLDTLLSVSVYNHGRFARPATDSHLAEYGVAHVIAILREQQANRNSAQQREALLAEGLSEEALARHEAHKQMRVEPVGITIDLDGVDLDGMGQTEETAATGKPDRDDNEKNTGFEGDE